MAASGSAKNPTLDLRTLTCKMRGQKTSESLRIHFHPGYKYPYSMSLVGSGLALCGSVKVVCEVRQLKHCAAPET